MGQTIIEKILSQKCGYQVAPGELMISDIDLMMGHDFNAAMTIEVFDSLESPRVAKPNSTFIVFDHAIPAPNENYIRIQQKIEQFAIDHQIGFYPPGEGICHQLLPERGHVKPGDVIIGSDSHTCTYGALNAFASGVGSTDLAVAMATGKLWFKVPPTIRINYFGKIPSNVFSKDIILYTIRTLRSDGALYKCIEFGGPAISELSIESRMTISNMSVEMGAKAGIFEVDQKTNDWLNKRVTGNIEPVYPDYNATYEKVYDINLSALVPQIALPHTVDNVCDISEVIGTPIHCAFIGSCSNGRLEDLRIAAKILDGNHIPKHVRLYIIPASRYVWQDAVEEGIISKLLKAGAILQCPSCGPCAGICGGIPGDNQNMISTATRNFKGRAGNSKSSIFLASPATTAASALVGKVINPIDFLGKDNGIHER